MAGIDLDGSLFDKAKVGIEMGIVIGDIFSDFQGAEVKELLDAILKFFDLVVFDPLFELGVDGGGFFLEDKGGGVEVEMVTDVEFVVEGDGGIVCGGVKVKVEKGCLFAKLLKSKGISLKVARSFPCDMVDSLFSERFKLVEKGDFREEWGGRVVGIFEKFQDIVAVF